jgi:hypothetical protein
MTEILRCDRCSVRLDPADAITNRRGTFCTTDCDERSRRDDWLLTDPPDIQAEDEFVPALIAT